ncbi:MAG: hypothetical protein OEO23_04490, partial [Gemmatimonadota bacterium]|nr:hypothetical protein [Gemmatimonadota bacterium]
MRGDEPERKFTPRGDVLQELTNARDTHHQRRELTAGRRVGPNSWVALVSLWSVLPWLRHPSPAAAQANEDVSLVPFRDLWGGIESFGQDTWHVFTSPGRFEGKAAGITAGTLAVGVVLFATDEWTRDQLAQDPGRLREGL